MDLDKTIKQLLNKTKKIQEKEQNNDEFNFLQALGIGSNEVIMCRLLVSLLLRKDSNTQELLYLKTFMCKVLQLADITDEELSLARITTEEVISDNRRIDIVIETPYRYIPIEVKIYAGEQKNQCNSYYSKAKNENSRKIQQRAWSLYYLTRYGYRPSAYSWHRDFTKGIDETQLESLKPISWKNDIYEWIEEILMADSIQLRPVDSVMLDQLADNILDFCDTSREQLMVEELINEDVNNLRASQLIIQSTNNVVTNFMRKFMDELYAAVRSRLDHEFSDTDIEFLPIYDMHTHVNNYYKKNPGSTAWPGFSYLLKNISRELEAGKDKLANKKYGLAVRFEISKNKGRLYLGYTTLEKTTENSYIQLNNNKEVFKYISNCRKEYTSVIADEQRKDWWFDWWYIPINGNYSWESRSTNVQLDTVPDFRHFNDAYYDLWDDTKRKMYIDGIVEHFVQAVRIFQ